MSKLDYQQLHAEKLQIERDYPFVLDGMSGGALSKEEYQIMQKYNRICDAIESENKHRYESDYNEEDEEDTSMEDSVGFIKQLFYKLFHKKVAHKKPPIYCNNIEISEQEFDASTFVLVHKEPAEGSNEGGE